MTSSSHSRPVWRRLVFGPGELPSLQRAGGDTVYTGEGEVALAFIEDIMERLGATPERIDRERARTHEEVFDDGG